MDKKVVIYLIKYIFQTILIYIIIKNFCSSKEELNKIIFYLLGIQLTFDILSNNKELFTLTNIFNSNELFTDSTNKPINNNISQTVKPSVKQTVNPSIKQTVKPLEQSLQLKKLLNELKKPGRQLKNDVYHFIKSSSANYIFDNEETFTVLFNGTKIFFRKEEYLFNAEDKIYYLNNDYTKNNFIKIIENDKFLTSVDNLVLKFISNTSKNKYKNKLKEKSQKLLNKVEKNSKKNLEEAKKSTFMFNNENNLKNDSGLPNNLYAEDQIKVSENNLDKLSKNMKDKAKTNDNNDKYFYRINAEDKEKNLNEKKKKIPTGYWNENKNPKILKRRFNKIGKCNKTVYKDLEPTFGLPFSNF